MKEIGGYFELEKLIDNEYYKDLIPLNNGRNALLYVLKVKNIKKLYIPYYLCDSISDMLKMYDYQYEYYNIDSDFMPVFNKTLDNDEYLLVVNYFGQLINEKITYLKGLYGQIILDNTHAFFQSPIVGIDTIYNCRKFFGVSDGAYLAATARIKDNLEMDISRDRVTHILGRYEGMASEYYDDFKNNDKAMKAESLKSMSKLTHNILGAIDYKRVREVRSKNYAFLNSKLGVHNKIKPEVSESAFAYPLYIENGINIRKELANKKIYISMLWPNVLTDTPKSSIEYDYAANILPLPCDQRYGINDMKYIVECLKKYVYQ